MTVVLTLEPAWLWPLVAAPAIGSFLGVVVLRLPAGGAVALARSACPSCGRQLSARDLIPLLSWAASRGRCRHCGVRLGWFYPVIELLALGVAAWSVLALPGGLVWVGCLLGWWLAALAAIDARTLILPDLLTLPLIAVGLGVTALIAPGALIDHTIGAGVGFAVIGVIGFAYRKVRGREGIGGGDVKLAAAAGAWVGWMGLPGVVLIAALSGLITIAILALFGRGTSAVTRIPFGPHLAFGLWITWVHGPLVIP